MLEGEVYVIGDEEVQVAIPIVIKETATGSPPRLIVPQPGCLGHIGKRSIPIVAIEAVLSEVGAEDVLESVVVVVADAYPGSPAYRVSVRPSRSRP